MAGRHSVGVEVGPDYLDMARRRFLEAGNDIFGLWNLEAAEQRPAAPVRRDCRASPKRRGVPR